MTTPTGSARRPAPRGRSAITIVNETPFVVCHRAGGRRPVAFSVVNAEPWSWALQVVVKATFHVGDGRATVAPEQLPIIERGAKTADGYVEDDMAFEKSGVDLVVEAEAYPPRGVAVREMMVTLRLGELSWIYSVVGDRTWALQNRVWAPTDPEPFLHMSLGYDRAFGGAHVFPSGAALPFTRNPIGKGWIPSLEGVEVQGRPLPNLEYADRRVVAPHDEPDPAGLAGYRMGWALRMMRGVSPQGDGPPTVLPGLWNAAHPDLILPEYPADKPLRLEGVAPAGLLELEVPRLPVALEHALGGRPERLAAVPDMLCLLPSRSAAFVVARWMIPFDPRSPGLDRVVRLVPESAETFTWRRP